MTTTESFTAFFINHGLTRALQKTFVGRGWSSDQMREFVANFQKKHGQQVPMPKIYGDEDTSNDKGPELVDGTKAVKKKTTGSAHGGDGPSTSSRSAGGSGSKKQPGVMMMMMMKRTLTNAGRQEMGMHHQTRWWLARSHARRVQVTPQSTESCQSFISLDRRRELCWVTVYSTGPMSKRERYTR